MSVVNIGETCKALPNQVRALHRASIDELNYFTIQIMKMAAAASGCRIVGMLSGGAGGRAGGTGIGLLWRILRLFGIAGRGGRRRIVGHLSVLGFLARPFPVPGVGNLS